MKKLVALLLTVVMLLSLVACGSAGETAENSEGGYDPDAKWAGIYTDPQWDGALPLVQEGEDNVITIGLTTNTNVIDYDTNEFTLWLEEQTGLDLQFVQLATTAADAVTQVNLMMAGGEKLPDVLMGLTSINKAMMKQYGRDGYFLNLSGYMATDGYYTRKALEKYYGEEYASVEDNIRTVTVDGSSGAMYCFPNVYQISMDVLTAQMWINQVWLDNLGLTAPTNVDELYDVLVAFRDQDPNGNGLKDEIPMMGRDAYQATDLIGWLINAYIFYNFKHKFNVENNVVYGPYDQDEYRQALIFIKKLVDEGLLSTITWTGTVSERKSMINPTGDFTVGICSNTYDEGFVAGHESIYQYVPLAPLAAETERGGYAPISADKIMYCVQITDDCENPQLAFRLLDFMCSEEAYLRGRWGVKGVDWDYVEEGSTLPGALGGEGRIVLLGDDVYAGVNNQNWHSQFSQISRDYWQFAQDLSDGSWKSTQYLKAQQQKQYYDAAGLPEQVFYEMERTDEEEALFSEYNNDLNSLIKSARAEFCNGVRDPESDADWQEYLEELAALHYQDAWIDVAQACWDRQQAQK